MYTSITATRAHDPHIVAAIASIYDQILPPERCLVIVNGDPPESGSVITELTERFPSVEIHHIEQIGMTHAFSFGIELAETEYIAFLDSDDLWEVDKQLNQISLLASNPELHAVYGVSQNFRESDGCRYPIGTGVAARLFSATTFRMTAFDMNGLPDTKADHFNWLYRWWEHAADVKLQVRKTSQLVLNRRIHDSNHWITDAERGKMALMQELRAIARKHRISGSPEVEQ